jgi:WXG100 family type VII secretion target
MTNAFRTDTGVMSKAAQDVNGVAERLNGMLNRLMNELAPLSTAWVGQGGSSFQAVKERFDADMLKLNTALAAISHAVGSAGVDYGVSDAESQSEVDRSGAQAGQITNALKIV